MEIIRRSYILLTSGNVRVNKLQVHNSYRKTKFKKTIYTINDKKKQQKGKKYYSLTVSIIEIYGN